MLERLTMSLGGVVIITTKVSAVYSGVQISVMEGYFLISKISMLVLGPIPTSYSVCSRALFRE